MKCQCGGKLQSDYTDYYKSLVRLAGPQPNHKKKRIQKKLMKRWAKLTARFIVIQPISRVMRCMSCKRPQGFYQAVARNTFRVEQLPSGALPIYEKYDS